jgi:hypothetical protein
MERESEKEMERMRVGARERRGRGERRGEKKGGADTAPDIFSRDIDRRIWVTGTARNL